VNLYIMDDVLASASEYGFEFVSVREYSYIKYRLQL